MIKLPIFKFSFTSMSLLIFALTLGTPLYATIYKWTDSNNEVHYSQSPPPGVSSTIIEIQDTPPSSSAAEEKIKVENLQNKQAAEEHVKEMDLKKENELNRIAKEKAHNCQTAKDYMTQLNQHVRIRLTDPKTNKTVMLTPKQRDEEITKTQAVIEANCN